MKINRSVTGEALPTDVQQSSTQEQRVTSETSADRMFEKAFEAFTPGEATDLVGISETAPTAA